MDGRVPDARPQHAIMASRAIATASYIEAQIIGVFAEMLGTDAAPTAAIFMALKSSTAQRDAIAAVAKEMLTEEGAELFSIVHEIVSAAMDFRNRVAHWLWAYSVDLPDHLLLITPRAHKEYSFAWSEAAMAAAREGKQIRPSDEIAIDYKDIIAYSVRDMEEAWERLHEAEGLVMLLRVSLSRHDSMSGPMSRLLLSRPAVIAAKKRRQKSGSTPPEYDA